MDDEKKKRTHGVQANIIVRALKTLEILKENTDENHKLTSEKLLRMVQDAETNSTDKTLRKDLTDLMSALNPVTDEYGDPGRREEFRIIYDGMGEGRRRKTGLWYQHEFRNDDIELLLELLRCNHTVSAGRAKRLETNLKKLGSKHYRYQADVIRNIPQISTVDTANMRKNLAVITEAISHNVRITFTFNRYDRKGELVPVRPGKYEVNPYYVVSYGLKYYLLGTHEKYEDVHIYRLDLMSEAELTQTKREPIQKVRELQAASVKEYMEKHINANYSEPRNIRLSVQSDGYTQLHDQFGDKYTFKGAIDEKHDEVEVTASAEGVVDWAILHMDRIEVLRPLALRKEIQEKAEKLLKKYENYNMTEKGRRIGKTES